MDREFFSGPSLHRLGLVVTAVVWPLGTAARLPAGPIAAWLDVADAAGHGHESATRPATTQPAAPLPATRAAGRAVFHAAPGEPLRVRWRLTNDGTEVMKDVLVHFYVVKAQRVGAPPPPLEERQVVIENALTMDFDPHDGTTATTNFRAPPPGVYLVRIETKGTSAHEGDEAHAELDMEVK